MKKVSLACVAAFIYILTPIRGLHAQGNEKNSSLVNQESFAFIVKNLKTIDTSLIGSNYQHINPKAIRDFIKYYKGSSDAEWSQLKDGRIVCRFVVDNTINRAYYDNKGNSQYTVASYTEDKLPGDIRNMVKSVYYDYAITYVNEIDMVRN